MLENPPPPRYELTAGGETLLITAALMALQSHLEFERKADGTSSFRFKKTPTKEKLLTPLLKKLIALLTSFPH